MSGTIPIITHRDGFHGALKVVADARLVDHVEDWSDVRSPGRARRRRAKHRQRIRYVAVPKREVYIVHGNTLVAHPAMIEELKRQTVRPA